MRQRAACFKRAASSSNRAAMTTEDAEHTDRDYYESVGQVA